MPCGSCGDARTLYCGSCGSRVSKFSACPWCGAVNEAQSLCCCSCGERIRDYAVCPWCEGVNDMTNSFCCKCGESITFESFPYSDKAITAVDKYREVLASHGFDRRAIERLVPRMRFGEDRCRNCGGTNEVVSVSREAVVSPRRRLGIQAAASFLQELARSFGEPEEDLNDVVSRKLEETWGWFCLACGEGWQVDAEDG